MSPPLTRRDFLRLSALMAGALALPPLAASASPMRRGRPKRVVVVGAGLAGLAAALELVEAGHDVVVLEAQMRPGGRVLTERDAFADGLYADLGAARIPSDHDLTLGYAARFGLQTAPFWPEPRNVVHLVGGRRIVVPAGAEPDLAAYPLAFTARERQMGLAAIDEAIFGPLLAAVGDARAPDWPPEALRPLDALTPAEYFLREGWSPAVVALSGIGYNAPEGSALSMLEELRIVALDPGAPRMKIVGGTDLLPKAMAALGDRIRYGRPVTRVEQDEAGVRLHTEGAAGPEVFVGERAVVTVPFPPLRRVAFSPPLSAGKRRAIHEMSYEHLSRVPLQVRRRPFVAEGLSGFARTDLPSEVWHATWDQPGERGIVSLYIKERASRRLTEMDEGERLAFAVEHAEAVLPGIRGEVEGGVVKSWAEDEWAGGAHAHLTPGQVTGLMPHVATVEGRLHFAGEHTSAWHGWMQGALESGLRAAREVDAAP